MAEAPVKVRFPTHPKHAVEVTEAIMAQVAGHGFPEHASFAIRLALDEALCNAINHGNRHDSRKRISVEYLVTPAEARITIEDEGPGFNPEKLPDPTVGENLERPNGRGVMLIKAYMTEVAYNDQGNRVTMVKRRDCPLPLGDDS